MRFMTLKHSLQNLYEIRTGIDKSGATLDQLEQELTHVRKEAFESNQQKNALNKEVIRGHLCCRTCSSTCALTAHSTLPQLGLPTTFNMSIDLQLLVVRCWSFISKYYDPRKNPQVKSNETWPRQQT